MPTAGSGSPSVVVINSHHHGNRGTHNGATASKVQAAVTPQNSTSGSVKAKFVDGEFSQSCELLFLLSKVYIASLPLEPPIRNF